MQGQRSVWSLMLVKFLKELCEELQKRGKYLNPGGLL